MFAGVGLDEGGFGQGVGTYSWDVAKRGVKIVRVVGKECGLAVVAVDGGGGIVSEIGQQGWGCE